MSSSRQIGDQIVSKLSPLGQSAAALMSPETERARAASKQSPGGAGAAASSFKVPGTKGLVESGKPEDSLGNPNGPGGYEPWGKKKKKEEEEAKKDLPGKVKEEDLIHTSNQGPEIIRIHAGWEKLLVAQKKLCEKAKALFLKVEGPVKYHSQKKGKFLQMKKQGCIIDLDTQAIAAEKAAEEKDKEKDKKAS